MSTSAPAPAPGAGVIGPTVDLYNSATDLNAALTPEQKEELKQNQLSSFSTGACIALTILTGGLFNLIYYGLANDQLPKVKPDDPSAGKFIVLLIIPLVNIIYTFIYWPRFVDRINFQYRLRGQPMPVDRGKVMTAVLLSMFGWILFIIPGIIGVVMVLQLVGQSQDAINGLAAERGA